MSRFRPLPEHPSIEFERKAAKALLRELRAGDAAAWQRMLARHESPTLASQPAVKLADAQRVIAREYGFSSWARLVRYYADVERQRYEHRAAGGWRPGIPSRVRLQREMQRLLRGHQARDSFHGRALAAYVPQLFGKSVEQVFAQEVSEDDAKLAVARQYGFANWEQLQKEAAVFEQLHEQSSLRVDELEDARQAIKRGDLARLQQLITASPELLTGESEFGSGVQRLLRCALEQEDTLDHAQSTAIVRWLESHGADLQTALNRQWGPRPEMTPSRVQHLLDRGADPDFTLPNGLSVLEHAVVDWWNGDAVDVLAARAKRRDALRLAAGLGDVRGVARWLDARGRPLAAARQSRPDFVAASRGIPLPMVPEPTDDELLQEALLLAVINGRANTIEYLASRGFDVNNTLWGEPMLVVAVGNGSTNAVEGLVRSGADVQLRGPSGESAQGMARSVWLSRGEERYRRIVELVGLDPDALLAE